MDLLRAATRQNPPISLGSLVFADTAPRMKILQDSDWRPWNLLVSPVRHLDFFMDDTRSGQRRFRRRLVLRLDASEAILPCLKKNSTSSRSCSSTTRQRSGT